MSFKIVQCGNDIGFVEDEHDEANWFGSLHQSKEDAIASDVVDKPRRTKLGWFAHHESYHTIPITQMGWFELKTPPKAIRDDVKRILTNV